MIYLHLVGFICVNDDFRLSMEEVKRKLLCKHIFFSGEHRKMNVLLKKTIFFVIILIDELKAQNYLEAQNLTDNEQSLLDDVEDESNFTTTKEEDMKEQKSLYLVFQSNQGCQKLTSELMQNLGPPAEFSNFDDFANAGDSNQNQIYSVQPGSSVNLTCLSEGPHGWTSTAPQFRQSLDKAPIVHEDLQEVAQFLDLLPNYNFGNIHYYSSLWIKNASYMHVGKYSCHPALNLLEEGEEEDGFNATSILYLYVYDSLHPPSVPLKKRQNTIRYYEDSIQKFPLLIPCRPSHPDFKVTLSKENDKYFTWLIPHFYHPRLGFVFPL